MSLLRRTLPVAGQLREDPAEVVVDVHSEVELEVMAEGERQRVEGEVEVPGRRVLSLLRPSRVNCSPSRPVLQPVLLRPVKELCIEEDLEALHWIKGLRAFELWTPHRLKAHHQGIPVAMLITGGRHPANPGRPLIPLPGEPFRRLKSGGTGPSTRNARRAQEPA